MRCLNCNSANHTMSNQLDEWVCDDCGFVIVLKIEENVTFNYNPNATNRDKPYVYNMSLECNMILSRFIHRIDFNTARDKTIHYLDLLENDSKFKEFTMPRAAYKVKFIKNKPITQDKTMLAAAVVFLVLKEQNVAIRLTDMALAEGLPPTRLSKLTKKIARLIEKPYLLTSIPIEAWLDRINHYANQELKEECLLFYYKVQEIFNAKQLTFTLKDLKAVIWLHGQVSPQFTIYWKDIKHSFGEPKSLKNAGGFTGAKRVLSALNLTKEQIKQLTMDELIGGIRYE